jgi:pyridoxamine 5'-phosphate oxidase
MARDAPKLKVTLDTYMDEKLSKNPESIDRVIINRDAISAMRRSYGDAGLSEEDVAHDPIEQFTRWLQDAAENSMVVEANGMVLSTVVDNQPMSRSVLLKDVSPRGFTFFTNYESQKGTALEINPNVSLLFPWYPMERQVIIRGVASKISRSESEAYFATRPWSSQIGAWASSQSRPLDSRETLEERYAEFAAKYPEPKNSEASAVPIPPYWGGYLVTPTSIEFWQGRYSRLHDRLRYTRDSNGANWKLERFYP